MSPDVQVAWSSGYAGQGTTMIFVDDFSSTDKFGPSDIANTGTTPGGFTGTESTAMKQHGYWTTEEGGLVAPSATAMAHDFSNEDPIHLATGFNVVNLSYTIPAPAASYTTNWASAYPLEKSVIDAATQGLAVISKAAGNDSVAVGTPASDGTLDYLAKGLIGTQSTIFVGALDHNGTTSNRAVLSSYSDFAGIDPNVQSHFLAVGVDYRTTGLAGTSFAAPIITGYAAILSSKFTTATPTQIANLLLSTARTDTVVHYSASTYGRGEASLANALAPVSIQ